LRRSWPAGVRSWLPCRARSGEWLAGVWYGFEPACASPGTLLPSTGTHTTPSPLWFLSTPHHQTPGLRPTRFSRSSLRWAARTRRCACCGRPLTAGRRSRRSSSQRSLARCVDVVCCACCGGGLWRALMWHATRRARA
jgi:hypothetical protein